MSLTLLGARERDLVNYDWRQRDFRDDFMNEDLLSKSEDVSEDEEAEKERLRCVRD
jgi:hypothetical protein